MVAENSLFQDARYVNGSLMVIANMDICKDFVFAIILELHPPDVKISNPMSYSSKEVCGPTGEEKQKSDTLIFLGLVSIPVAFTLAGLTYMCKKICCRNIQEKCYEFCSDMEKTDVNTDYGDYYYYASGDRRRDLNEVKSTFEILIDCSLQP